MRLIFLFTVILLWVQPRAAIAEDFVKEVSDIWQTIAADESAIWPEEEVAASKAKTLLGRAKKADDFEPLFGEALSNATCTGAAWSMTDGILAPTGRGDIWTRERYGNFMLELEFKCAEDSNSGVFIRCDDVVEWLHTAIEIQILQPEAGNDRHNCGGVFDCKAPAARAIKPAGEWNHYLIVVEGSRILVVLNSELVLDMNLDDWTEAGRNPDGTPNKFKHAYRDMVREGHIGLQEHGQPIWFRNMRVKSL